MGERWAFQGLETGNMARRRIPITTLTSHEFPFAHDNPTARPTSSSLFFFFVGSSRERFGSNTMQADDKGFLLSFSVKKSHVLGTQIVGPHSGEAPQTIPAGR